MPAKQSNTREFSRAMMNSNYRAADNAAKRGALAQASAHLAAAERWRVKARSLGAKV